MPVTRPALQPNSAAACALEDFHAEADPGDQVTLSVSKAPQQRSMSMALDKHTRTCLLQSLQGDLVHRAHLEFTSAESADQWLHALPSAALHNRVEPLLFKTMVQRWLRLPIFPEAFVCSECNARMDVYGDYALTCCGGGDRTKRHNILRNSFWHFCFSAGLAPELEKPGLLQPRPLQGFLLEDGVRRDNPDARRPAYVYLPRFHQGSAVCFDFAVTSGMRSSNLARSLLDASSRVRAYEDFKCTHLDTRNTCISEGLGFIPLVAEAVGGAWGPSATKVFASLAKTKSNFSGEAKNTIVRQLYQHLGILLHRANARAVLRRCAPPEFVNAAAALCSCGAPIPSRVRSKPHKYQKKHP